MKLLLIITLSLLMFGCTNPKESRYPAQAGFQAEDYGEVKVPRQVPNRYGKNFFNDFDQADEGKNVAKIIGKLARSQANNAAPLVGTESFKELTKRVLAEEAKIFLAPKKYAKIEGKVDDGRNDLYKTLKLMDWMRGNPIELFRQLREGKDLPGTKDPNKHHFVVGPLPGIEKYYKADENGKKDVLPSGESMATDNLRTVFIVHNEDVREALNNAKMTTNPNDNVFSVAFYNPKMDRTVGSEFMLSKEFGFTRQEKLEMRKIMPRSDMGWIQKMVTGLTQKAIRQSNVNGQIDIVNAVARRIPMEMTRHYFGYQADLRSMYRWSRATQKSFFHNPTNSPGHERRAKKAGEELREHVRGMIVEHLKTGNHIKPNTIFHRLMNLPIPESFSNTVNSLEYDKTTNKDNRACVGANNSYYKGGKRVSEEQCIWYERVVANIIGTLVGGTETTQAAIVNAIDFFLDNPEIMKHAVSAAKSGNQRRVAAFVWEALRFRPINPIVMRYVQEDYTFASGRKVFKGDVAMLATLSAMHDDSGDRPAVIKPDNFIIGRGTVNANKADRYKKRGESRDNAYFFHLGNGSHKCLGDYVAQALVPAVVTEILKLPGLARLDHNMLSETNYPEAKRTHGYIDFHDNIGAFDSDGDAEVSSAFPETMILQTSLPQSPNKDIHGVTIADPRFIFEDFLMDFDKNEFRMCLSDIDGFESIGNFEGEKFDIEGKARMLVDGYYNRVTSGAAADLFYCRLPKEFRECIQADKQKDRSKLFNIKEQYLTKYESCLKDKVTGKEILSPREKYFYKTEILNILPKELYDKYVSPQWYARNGVNKYGRTPLEIEKVPLEHASFVANRGPAHTHEPWEEVIKFYDRTNQRQTYMNPLTAKGYPITDSSSGNKLNFYTRIDLEFKKCNSKEVSSNVKNALEAAEKGYFGFGKKKLSLAEIDSVKVKARFATYEQCIKEKYAMPDYIFEHFKRNFIGM